jgi:hypothetical protein
VLWIGDRVLLAFRVLGATIAEFEQWYLKRHAIDRREFRKDVKRLLEARAVKRVSKRVREMVAFAQERGGVAAARAIRILTEPVSLLEVERISQLPLREILAIEGLSLELQAVLARLAPPPVEIRDYLELHRQHRKYLREVVCGHHNLFRRHSTVEGLVTDLLSIEMQEDDELRCRAELCNIAEQRERYAGIGLFDGVKVMVYLEKVDHDSDYIDTITLMVTFDAQYRHRAGLLIGSVDRQRDVLCATRVALMKSAALRKRTTIVRPAKMTRQERELYFKLDNSVPLHGRDRVLLFDNFSLNAQAD